MADVKPENAKEVSRLTAVSVGASAAGLALSVGIGVLKSMTGDVIGAAENFGTASSIFSKVTGLDPVLKRAGRYFKENFVGKSVASVAEKAWGILTSKPVKLALKLTGIALVMASAATPVGWACAGLGLAAATIGVVAGAVNAGKTKRLEAEANNVKETLKRTGEIENGKFPAIDNFLNQKFRSSQVKGVNRAAVGRETLASNLAESAGLVLEALSTGDPLTAAASGISILGNVTSEASEAYKEKFERNELRSEIDRSKAKAICKIISNDPNAANLTQEGLAKRYKEVEDIHFPKENPVKTAFKDFGRGIIPYFTNGIKKLFSKSSESHDTSTQVLIPESGRKVEIIKTQAKTKAPVLDTVLLIDPHDMSTSVEKAQPDKNTSAYNLEHNIEMPSNAKTEYDSTRKQPLSTKVAPDKNLNESENDYRNRSQDNMELLNPTKTNSLKDTNIPAAATDKNSNKNVKGHSLDKHTQALNLAHSIEIHTHRDKEHKPTLHEAPSIGKALKKKNNEL